MSPLIGFALLVSLVLSLVTWCLVVLPILDWWTARRRQALMVRRVS